MKYEGVIPVTLFEAPYMLPDDRIWTPFEKRGDYAVCGQMQNFGAHGDITYLNASIVHPLSAATVVVNPNNPVGNNGIGPPFFYGTGFWQLSYVVALVNVPTPGQWFNVFYYNVTRERINALSGLQTITFNPQFPYVDLSQAAGPMGDWGPALWRDQYGVDYLCSMWSYQDKPDTLYVSTWEQLGAPTHFPPDSMHNPPRGPDPHLDYVAKIVITGSTLDFAWAGAASIVPHRSANGVITFGNAYGVPRPRFYSWLPGAPNTSDGSPFSCDDPYIDSCLNNIGGYASAAYGNLLLIMATPDPLSGTDFTALLCVQTTTTEDPDAPPDVYGGFKSVHRLLINARTDKGRYVITHGAVEKSLKIDHNGILYVTNNYFDPEYRHMILHSEPLRLSFGNVISQVNPVVLPCFDPCGAAIMRAEDLDRGY